MKPLQRNTNMLHKAIFLDKDGTLVENVPYNVDISLIQISKNTLGGLRLLQEKGFKIIVVSNQSGIAKGLFNERDLDKAIKKIFNILEEKGIALDGFYYCPHDAGEPCDCRKPKAGMLHCAADEHHIDLSQSWMIGDILDDVEAGNRAGCRSLLIHNNNETEWNWTRSRLPYAIVSSINEAAHVILESKYEFVV